MYDKDLEYIHFGEDTESEDDSDNSDIDFVI